MDATSIQRVSKLTSQWIELFRAGDHGEKHGGVFTDADLDQIVANYKPTEFHEAPATIGHPPEDDDRTPAYGWWGALKRVGSSLWGQLSEVRPEFEEMVEKQLFKKRSVGLVKNADGQTGWGLHHVAFLGATAPKIKGLADCKFKDSSAPVVEVEFQENAMANENQDTVLTALKAWFEEKFGSKTVATATFSEADVKRIAGEAVVAAVKPLQDSLDAQKAEFAERDKKTATSETTARAEAAIGKLKSQGRWVPAFDKAHLPAVFAELAKSATVVEFTEGTEKKTIAPLDALTAFMETLPKFVPGGDIYSGQVAKQAAGAIKFSEANGPAAPNSVTLANLAHERATKDKIAFGEAMILVASERPELATTFGGASAGTV